jgi:hypothetical protein
MPMLDHPAMADRFKDWPRGCEHGRSVLALGFGSGGGEIRICAGDAWQSGWIENGWPPGFARDTPMDAEERRNAPFNRWFTGPPAPALPVDCECACVCSWNGPFDVVSADAGVLRCPRCTSLGHPPVGRWTADIMGTRPADLRW